MVLCLEQAAFALLSCRASLSLKGSTMSITPYELSVPAFQSGFAVLSKLLDKAEAFAEEKKIKPEILVNAR